MNFHFSIPQRTWRACFAWLVVLALASHGLIPVGYMPDSARAPSQPLAMTMCDGTGPMMMGDFNSDRGSGETDKSKTDQKAQAHAACPFSVGSVFSFDDFSPHFAVPFGFCVILFALTAFAFSARRRFGNAAPRAPPAIS